MDLALNNLKRVDMPLNKETRPNQKNINVSEAILKRNRATYFRMSFNIHVLARIHNIYIYIYIYIAIFFHLSIFDWIGQFETLMTSDLKSRRLILHLSTLVSPFNTLKHIRTWPRITKSYLKYLHITQNESKNTN